ncbi:alpha-1,2-mannosidase, putative [Nonlabens sp. Hel1_33_55]|uniref:GH92 family glycosyl hydrolase n=1 Tax=Nonlabens sp. Hel1_33_55 TaxID=1336802 RepID=UPI000875DA7F|nr:GH92 family glycosyl hydrolase [Nonlabens sp. Hel1_33_55]SCY25820.1 alpha-1,2-mannosidase, putative [Nonlabens sp. Hel1_33_55]
MKYCKWVLLGLLLAVLISCDEQEFREAKAAKPLTEYVNPFVGTGGHGHTYPGASMPFGMMQLSPDTRLDGWDGCSGYHYSDDKIYGFSHTHLSGTGVSDYGDVLLMPTNKPVLNNGADGNDGYRSSFSPNNETASPGYYSVKLDDTDIKVELTVSKRSGIHRYQYPDSLNQFLILDLEHRDKLLEHELNLESATEISGKRFSSAWASNQMLYCYMKTSHPIKDWDKDVDNSRTKKALKFENPDNDPVIIKIGISAVDVNGAKRNLQSEIGDKTFDEIHQEAKATWEKELSKIIVEDDDEDKVATFYTALYHTMLAPNLYQDVDGRYRGMDLEVHQTNDFDYYTVFSLWDTYRAAHPLYTIIDQKRTNDFINTFTAKYDEGGIMPIWDLSGNYTGCMIGYHAVPVIADAYMKGIDGFDVVKAFEAMKHSAMQDKLGLKSYKKLGFIPVEEESESVSKTLEYAYDDWTIAQMAEKIGALEDYETFIKRAQNYKNLYNPETGFFQGRFRNTWFSPFDPFEVNFNYTEANAWQYSLYAPQDILGHIRMMGGEDDYEKHLDNLFTATAKTSGRDQADITGLIGQYAHGNEPSHHMAYLYNYVGKSSKTQEKVHEILTTLYSNHPDGISGNEDCGQMSAWYVLSSLGFYPVTPASNQYAIGSPLFDKATIHFENGKSLTITKNGDGKYIDALYMDENPTDWVNARSHNTAFITHEQLMAGGSWNFKMSNTPDTWGSSLYQTPTTSINDFPIVTAPFIKSGDISFPKSTTIELGTTMSRSDIYYSLDYGQFQKYDSTLSLDKSVGLRTFAVYQGISSDTVQTDFHKYDADRSVELNYDYANEYSAGGKDALIDGLKGSVDYRSGAWHGIKDQNLDIIIDLGSVKSVNEVEVNFLKEQRSWIFYPRDLEVILMDSNKEVIAQKKLELPSTGKEEVSEIHTSTIQFDGKQARYVKVVANNYGKLPEWHLGFPMDGTAWIFVDEISIE